MTFDPWAPPPDTAPPQYQPPPPQWQGYGYPPLAQPSKRAADVTGVVLAIVGGIVTLGLLGWGLSTLAPDAGPPVTEVEHADGGYRVYEDERGPAFVIDLPDGWTARPARESEFRASFSDRDRSYLLIDTLPGGATLTPEQDLDRVLREFASTHRVDPPLSRPVAGVPALIQRVNPEDGLDRRIAVFRGQGHRWVVFYAGPDRGVREEPPALGNVLDSWRWP